MQITPPPNGAARQRPSSPANRQHDCQRQQDRVVEVAQNRDEVRDDINWREGITADAQRKRFDITSSLRISRREIERMNVALYRSRAVFDPRQRNSAGQLRLIPQDGSPLH